MQKVKELINKIDTPLWLEIFFAVLLLLRIPSFFEPYYYGDEMIYLTLGQGVRYGLPLYLTLHDNKPPLIYLMAALGGNLFFFKVILAFWSLITVYGFWKLIKTLFPNKEILHKVSTVIFGLLTTLPLLEGNTVNAELLMIGPVIFGLWILFSKQDTIKNLVVAGMLFSIGALFKMPSVFDLFGLFAFWLIYLNFKKKGSFKEVVRNTFFVSLGFAIPLSLTFLWYFSRGALKEYVIAAFLQNLGYVSSWRANKESISFLEKNGPLLIRAGLMFLGYILLFFTKSKLPKSFVFICSWLLATLFAVTLSERPYPHYFVQSIAPVSILLGLLLTSQSIIQGLVIIPLTLAFFIPFYYKFWYYPTSTYYLKFFKFATKQMSKDDYFRSFSPNVLTNYKIADFLVKSAKPDEKVFVWSNDSPAIYALSRRLPPTKYVADYHIVDFSTKEETMNTINRTKPKFIVLTPNSPSFPELDEYVNKNYYLISQIDSSSIWLYLAK